MNYGGKNERHSAVSRIWPAATRLALVAKLSDTLAQFVVARNWLSADRAMRATGEARDRSTVNIAAASRGEEMRELVAHLRTAGRFAFDTEFVSEETFEPVLCLVQVATRERLAAIDALAVRDLAPLWQLVIDPAVEPNSGLRYPSVASCTNLLTVDQGLVAQTIGRLSAGTMQRIDDCLKAALGLP